MLPTEVSLVIGIGLIVIGRALMLAGRTGMTYTRDVAQRIVDSAVTPLYKRVIINSHLDSQERELSALRIVHAQSVIANTLALARVTELETLLQANGLSIPHNGTVEAMP